MLQLGRKQRDGGRTCLLRAEAGIRDYPRDAVIQHHAELQQLLLDMAASEISWRQTRIRPVQAYDTARLLYIKTVAFPSLRLGKRIDTEDCPELMDSEGTILDHSRRGGAHHGKRTRSDGVRHGKCCGGEQSRLRCVYGYLLVAGTQKDGPHRARQGKPKV